MTGYLTSVLTMALSWVRGVASSIWRLVGGEGEGGFLDFLAAHWKGLLLGLCIAGLLCDLAVYLLRWRPDKVWVSFFRRLRRRAEDRRVYRELMAQPDTAAVPQLTDFAAEEPEAEQTCEAGLPEPEPPEESTLLAETRLDAEEEDEWVEEIQPASADTETVPVPITRHRRSERS